VGIEAARTCAASILEEGTGIERKLGRSLDALSGGDFRACSTNLKRL
jgi:hypothetical protein